MMTSDVRSTYSEVFDIRPPRPETAQKKHNGKGQKTMKWFQEFLPENTNNRYTRPNMKSNYRP